MTKIDHHIRFRAGGRVERARQTTRVLAIGDREVWMKCGSRPPETASLAYSRFEDLNDATLSSVEPDIVVSPVVAPDFDCIDVASLLSDLGFRGAYRAITRRLPNPTIVRREVRALCPGLDFDVVMQEPDGASPL